MNSAGDDATEPATDLFPALGWDPGWEQEFSQHAGAPARVTRVDRGVVRVLTRGGPLLAAAPAGLPALVTGDWLAISADETPQIRELATRRTALLRRDPGEERAPQLLAANMDQVWIVHAVDQPLRAGWLDRALVMAYGSGATPVIVVTKADLIVAAADLCSQLVQLAPGVIIQVTSVTDRLGLEPLVTRLRRGRTAALVGRSGSGKSSLVNALAGAAERIGAVRTGDARGRHTTTRRALVLAAGGSVIDSPGVRALALWEPAEGLALAFPDIAQLATHCRFDDCRHREEPGCAVRAAVDGGQLSADRLRRYLTLSEEQFHS